MSLQLIAKEMEAKGRKGDSMLVHMTPGEVAGLQKLAESAGGSLSVNPDTGLVEANFLKQMLPTLVGAGVGFFTGNPMYGAMAGAAVGGVQAKRSGRDVGSGMVMGGLGGYGGATFGSSIQAAGAPATASTSGTGATAKPGADMVNRAMMQQAMGGQPTPPIQNPLFVDPAQAQQQAIASAPLQMPSTAAGAGQLASQVPTNMQTPGNVPAGAPTKFSDMTYSQRLDQGRRGLEALGTKEGRDAAYKDLGGSESIMRKLMFAGLPAMYGARTSVPHPYRLLSADLNKRGFAEGGSTGVQGPGLINSLLDSSSVANRKYIIDPATGDVILNPNIRRPAPTFTNMVGSDGGGYEPAAPNPDFDTPEKRAAYYAERPIAGMITRAGQTALGYMPVAGALMALQNRMDPGLQQERRAETYGTVIDIGDPIGRSNIQGTSLGDLAPGGSYNFSGDDSMDFGSEAQGGPIGNQNFGGGFDYGGSYDSFSSDVGTNEGSGTGYGGDGSDFAAGGLMGLAKGGMKSGGFVVPADVVSMVGEGNTDAGYKRIKSMVPSAVAIKGKDGGQSDTVKTSIEGKQRARVAHGEMYIPPETVKRMGGAKKLYAMMDRVRQQATGSKKQIKPVSLKRAMA
jgi:hypothetical protein